MVAAQSTKKDKKKSCKTTWKYIRRTWRKEIKFCLSLSHSYRHFREYFFLCCFRFIARIFKASVRIVAIFLIFLLRWESHFNCCESQKLNNTISILFSFRHFCQLNVSKHVHIQIKSAIKLFEELFKWYFSAVWTQIRFTFPFETRSEEIWKESDQFCGKCNFSE